MPILTVLFIVLVGLVLVGFGVLSIEYPQIAYSIRHWSLASSGDSLTTAGESTERSLGYVWLLLGGFLCVTGVVLLL